MHDEIEPEPWDRASGMMMTLRNLLTITMDEWMDGCGNPGRVLPDRRSEKNTKPSFPDTTMSQTVWIINNCRLLKKPWVRSPVPDWSIRRILFLQPDDKKNTSSVAQTLSVYFMTSYIEYPSCITIKMSRLATPGLLNDIAELTGKQTLSAAGHPELTAVPCSWNFHTGPVLKSSWRFHNSHASCIHYRRMLYTWSHLRYTSPLARDTIPFHPHT